MFIINENNITFVIVYYRHGNWAIDRFLMTYDLRMMRAMSPIPMQIDPMFLRFMPTYSNRICVVSQVSFAYFNTSLFKKINFYNICNILNLLCK